MPETHFKDYLKKLESALVRGDSTEHTHRPALKHLIESIAKGIVATNEPKRSAVGAPDYIVMRGKVPLGYIEAKDVGRSLNDAEQSEQLVRYREGLSNLILTDYLEFRWYVRGERRLTCRLANVERKGTLRLEEDAAARLAGLFDAFIKTKVPVIDSPKDLAERMASLARLIRDAIHNALEDEDKSSSLYEQMEGFKKVLLHDLTNKKFADMYAQTICYGLFAARCNSAKETEFTREHAAFDLPKTNPFLRNMFARIAGPELDERITWAVDDLAEILNRSNIEAILKNFGKRTRREDPVVHFYETFLSAYDPVLREKRGVYYTPEPVVTYIVRSVDHILKKDFSLQDGLADSSTVKFRNPKSKTESDIHKVLVLDPATGTGTFLYNVVDHIHESFKGDAGMWSSYVSSHLLPRLFGFEILTAPYTIAHMKIGLQLTETGYNFASDERIHIYLTNTLEKWFDGSYKLPFTEWLIKEANSAGKVKQDSPVMVILGNPPYSGHSANVGEWIKDLLKGKDSLTGKSTGNYFEIDGKPLGERNPKWLHDDYVKFIRFSQWRIEQTGYGILAFITNHGYLDNPTFRGMRQALLQTFDDIYILDLHGNAKKREKCPDGTKDENVFDIQQGVSIGIFVKRSAGGKKPAKVMHADLWGLREAKYEWLKKNEITKTSWESLSPTSPFYFFVPQDVRLREEYEKGWKITDVMPVNVLGFQTHRDDFAISFDEDQIRAKIDDLRKTRLSDDELRERYGLKDNRDWQLSAARERLKTDEHWETHFMRCLYRPLDLRWCYFAPVAMDYPRRELIDHVAGEDNYCLLVPRQIGTLEWAHVSISKDVAESCVVSTKTKEQNYDFPLYLYPVKSGLFKKVKRGSGTGGGRRPNLSSRFVEEISKKLQLEFVPDGKGDYKKTFGPEDVLSYLYAIFHSPTYRSRYAEFLKSDFPRVSITSDKDLFQKLCDSGEELMSLHLIEKIATRISRYPVDGSDKVEKVLYMEPGEGSTGHVYINDAQYFTGIPPEIWKFRVGSYQVCQKWLKDRKGRQLSHDDKVHYQRIVSALSETIRLMDEIDETIENHGGWPLGEGG